MQADRLRLAEVLAGARHAQHRLLLAETGFQLVEHVVHVPAELPDFILLPDVDDAAGDLAGGDIRHQRLQVVHARIVRRGRCRHKDRHRTSGDQQHEHDEVEAVAVENPEHRRRE